MKEVDHNSKNIAKQTQHIENINIIPGKHLILD
jgi:hypothetical protein